MKTSIRKSHERGHVEGGWLKSRHSFSFGSYFDPEHMGFGPLRVINDDWIDAESGFGMHPHEDMEIMTIVLEGELEHKDSLGNGGVLNPGDVQLMRAGTGIVHSEFNHSKDKPLHLYQIWIEPSKRGLDPSYQQEDFSEKLNSGNWVLVASSDWSDESLNIKQDLSIWRKRSEKSSNEDAVKVSAKKAWIQVLKGGVDVDSIQLNEGDALGLEDLSGLDLSKLKLKDQSDVLVFAFN